MAKKTDLSADRSVSEQAAIVKVSPALLAGSGPLVTAEIVEDLTTRQAKASKIKEAAALIRIESDADAAQGAAYLKAIHVQHKELEDQRKAIADPLTKAKKAVDALFKAPLNDLEIAKGAISLALGQYQVRAAQERARLLAASTQEAQTPEERRALIVAGTEAAPKLQGTREYVSFEVTIIDSAAIPREFLVPDVERIRATIAASDGAVNIPGVQFEKIVRVGPTGR